MATPTIQIDQAGLGAGSPGESRDDGIVGALVTLTDPANVTGPYAWTLFAKPPGSAAVLAGDTTATATFTPDIEGTYLVRLINGSAARSYQPNALGVQVSSQGGFAVKFQRNGLRAPAAQETLQFGATGWQAALWQIIRALPRVLNCVPDTDITEALQAEVENATRDGGEAGKIIIPEGRYRISDTINVQQRRGLQIEGMGEFATRLVWYGADDRPMFVFNRCNHAVIRSLAFECNTGLTLRCCVYMEHGAVDNDNPKHIDNLTSSLCRVENTEVIGAARIEVGFRVYVPNADDDIKNDFHSFSHNRVSGVTWAAFVLEGRNAKNIGLYHNVVQPGSVGDGPAHGLLTIANWCPGDPGFDEDLSLAQPLFGHGASAQVFGGAFQGCTQSAMTIGDRNDPFTATGVYSEKCVRHLWVPEYATGQGGGVAAFPIVLSGNRCSGQDIHADGKAVLIEGSNGPVTIIGGEYGDRDATQNIRIHVDPRQSRSFVLMGAFISNSDGNVFTGIAPSNAGPYGYSVQNDRYDGTETTDLGHGVVIPTDGGFKFPRSAAAWALVLPDGTGPVPAGQWPTGANQAAAWVADTEYDIGEFVINDTGKVYECITDGISASSGGPTGTATDITDNTAHWAYIGDGTGVVEDYLQAHHMIATGALEYEQPITGLTDHTGVHMTQSGGECLSPQSTFANPVTDAIAWLETGWITTVTGSSRTLNSLGNGSEVLDPGGGGALKSKITTAGLIEAFSSGPGVIDTGAIDHRAQLVRILTVYDKAADTLSVYTNLEVVTGSVAGATVTNNANHSVGANSGQSPDWLVTEPVVFVGQAAIDIVKSAAWRTSMGLL